MDAAKLAEIDRAVDEALKAHKMPGCVVAVGHRGRLVWLRAYGARQLQPERVPMTTDTMFDLASLTKPIATATSVMLLVEQGKVALDEPVVKYLPEFGRNGKEAITVAQLLTHQAGLVPDNALGDYRDGPQKAWERVCSLKPTSAPGSKFVYSDVGFIVLGELVRRVSGKTLHEFTQEQFFRPLGMNETGFLPGEGLRRRAAPTEKRDGQWIVGAVHDPRSHLLGGIAGHAGLFSTAQDLAIYAQMLLAKGEFTGHRVLRPETVALMTKPRTVSSGLRGLGWDMRTGYSSNRGATFSSQAFGHGGFTGTSLWIDPGRDLFVIFLSNRVHPDGKGSVNPLAGRIGTLAADAIRTEGVLPGIDVLRRDGFAPLQGRKIGLITNQTGVARDGQSTAVLLQKAPGVTLVALFSPEHGPQGKLDVGNIQDARDEQTGLVVYSLYGATRRPTEKMLGGIDTLVFDIQDIGARFYTYPSTMGNAMEEAAKRKMRFVVLDRPNPIGGQAVAGPVLDAGRESFVGYHRIPVRHGMTLGELARMFNDERQLGLDLHVAPIEGWRRGDRWEATGLRWVNPSPNMRSPSEALLYPGVGLLETTNLSVGRGTPAPFERIGAPWLDGRRLADALNARKFPGVRFEPIEFTPDASVHAGKKCGGVAFVVTDGDALEPVAVGIEIACRLRADYRDVWQAKNYDRLLGNAHALEALLAGKSTAEIQAGWQEGLESFMKRRAKYLLYP
jgi:uncharacterized protein YbbC (DUF1343 family)